MHDGDRIVSANTTRTFRALPVSDPNVRVGRHEEGRSEKNVSAWECPPHADICTRTSHLQNRVSGITARGHLVKGQYVP